MKPIFILILSCVSLIGAKVQPDIVLQPNIVLIMADDMGFSDIGCYGGEIQTPNLDRLAAGGLRFRQFYNNAKCSPTRASLLSGQDYHDTGTQLVTGPNLGQILSDAGYRTYAVGKWHLQGNPVDRGFDRYFGHLGGATGEFGTSRGIEHEALGIGEDDDTIGKPRFGAQRHQF